MTVLIYLKVYKRRRVLHIDRISRQKANGASMEVGIHPSKVAYVMQV